MHDSRISLVEDIRKLLSGYTSNDFTFKRLAKDINQPVELLTVTFGSESGLVEAILDFEQQNLEDIFSKFNPEGANSIDNLLRVSKEVSHQFVNILPSIVFDLREQYPEIRQKFVERRVNFINTKIKSNFEQGIFQGMYRNDLSPELLSRIYISRLIDLHNPDFFPNETISFPVLFDLMVDTFIRGICTDEGKTHYEKKIRCIKF